MFYSFVLDKPTGQKIKKSLGVDTIESLLKVNFEKKAFCLEKEKRRRIEFNGETMNFVLLVKKDEYDFIRKSSTCIVYTGFYQLVLRGCSWKCEKN